MHILIVRPGAIGDTLLTFPILDALRTLYADCIIMYAGNSAVLPLLRAAGLADGTFDYGSLLWSELFATSGIRSPLLRDITQQVDYAICWLRDPDGIVRHNLQLQGIQQIVVALGRPPDRENVHIVRYLAQTLGIADRITDSYHMNLERGVTNKREDETIQRERPFAIHPGSGGAAKCWPVSNFAVIIHALWQHHIPVLLLAGFADEERVTQLLELIGTPPQASLLTLVANAPLLDVAAQLRSCRGYLGNDSGISHLAAMLDVPTLALFGPSNPAVWHPVGKQVQVVYEQELTHLSVHVVMGQIEKMLNPS
ncbi:MAG TPA: hypothetical protein DHW02_12545 [Ktedonobacter sp.]|nr:hypothetical protein [Ktedonobacter sp.]